MALVMRARFVIVPDVHSDFHDGVVTLLHSVAARTLAFLPSMNLNLSTTVANVFASSSHSVMGNQSAVSGIAEYLLSGATNGPLSETCSIFKPSIFARINIFMAIVVFLTREFYMHTKVTRIVKQYGFHAAAKLKK